MEVVRDRVYRLMRKKGLKGVRRGKKKRTTTPDEKAAERARDPVQRDFTATRPDAKWVCDITYVRTWQGFSYLAFILDVYSRMIVGWQLAQESYRPKRAERTIGRWRRDARADRKEA
jgi:putative transposase